MLNEDLEQRELFNKFYEITDQAIDKAVSFQDIDGLSVSQNELIRGCIKTTLVDAKKYNQSKETAVAYSESRFGEIFGTEHGVNINSSTEIFSIINRDDFCVVFHNHPSTQTFSITDLNYFLFYKKINVFGVVSNLGNVELLIRWYDIWDDKFWDLEDKLGEYFKVQLKGKDTKSMSQEELYHLSKTILSKFKEFNYYIHLK